MTMRETLEKEAAELRAARDDLRVRMHLGKLEARELWEKLEKQWDHVEGRMKVLADATQEAAEDVGAAAKVMLDELKEGYEKLRRLV